MKRGLIFYWLLLLPVGARPDELRLSGAWALYPLAVRWAEEFQKIHPEIEIAVVAGGTGKGMDDLLAGRVDIAMASRAVTPAEVRQGAVAVAVCKDAVVPVINARNPVLQDLARRGVTKEVLAAAWLKRSVRTWGAIAGTPREAPLRVLTRSDACGAAETWASWLGGTPADLQGERVLGDPGMMGALRRDPWGLGYCNVNYAYDPRTGQPAAGIAILPLDLNGNGALDQDEDFYRTRNDLVAAIRDGRYPSPPARDLFFVVKGDPANRALRSFLDWVLTDGQKLAAESGCIPRE